MRLDGDQSDAWNGTLRLLKQHGLEADRQALLAFVRDQADKVPTIVVVGEVKRGKSTLVNALVGRADVSPVGVEVVTAGFVRILPPSADVPDGTANLVLTDRSRRPVAVAEVAAWMTAGGPQPDGSEGDLVPVGAEIAVASRWLPGVELVDTPGVGGLDSIHTLRANQAAKKASALLFVSDAGQVLTAPELEFLRGVAAVVDTVVFALTKTDRHPSGWREVMAENRRLLRQHAPRFASAPVLPVSAALALTALTTADDAVRPVMEEASGLPALAAELRARVADADRLAIGNVLRAARSALDLLAVSLHARLDAVDATPEQRGDLIEERSRLEELREKKGRWTYDLDRDLGRLRREMVVDIADRVERLRQTWLSRIARERRGAQAAVAQQYAAELDSALALLAGETADAFQPRLAHLVETMFEEGADTHQLTDAPEADLRTTRMTVVQRTSTRSSLIDPSLVGSAVMGMGLAGKLGVAGVAGAAFLNPVMLFAGGAYLAATVGFRALRLGREQLTQVLTDTLRSAETELVAAVDSALREIKPEILVAYRDQLNRRIDDLNAEIRAADTARKASQQERDALKASAEQAVAAVTAQQLAIDRAMERLAGTSAPPAASNR